MSLVRESPQVTLHPALRMLPSLDLAALAEDLRRPAGPAAAGLYDVPVWW
ncbi:hypothetical protein [Streptomyces sp. NPDC006355]